MSDDLFFNRISPDEYQAPIAIHDGDGWQRSIYTVRSTPALRQNDAFHAWEGLSPDGFLVTDSGVSLIEAMRACNADVENFSARAEADNETVIIDPELVHAAG